MRREKVVLVGNGASLIDSRLGERIDAFPTIIRFNDFVIRGFEDDVGNRTTIWSTWYKGSPNQLPGLDEIWLNMPVRERTIPKLREALCKFRKDTTNLRLIPTYEQAAIIQECVYGRDSQNYWPSSGLLAVAHCLHQGHNVSIAGIDSWQSGPDHYYRKHSRKGSHHKAKLEARYFRELVKTGDVEVLE